MDDPRLAEASRWPRGAASILAIVLPTIVGAALLAGTINDNSATYDEVAYVRIACRWWRTGDQAEITRMGSPVTFWKWQAAPALALLDATGRGGWIDAPRQHLPETLPWIRASASWIWFAGLWIVQYWAARAYGRKAAIAAGALYALGPNLRAHGALATMETPLWTFVTLATMCLCEYVRTGARRWMIMAAVAAGAAFSMKFTAVALPVLFAGIVTVDNMRRNSAQTKSIREAVLRSGVAGVRFGAGFLTLMLATNLAVTGFATIAPSERTGGHPWLDRRFPPAIARGLAAVIETPLPVDWVGFLVQLRHQQSGGPGYLLGETSHSGWPQYYLVALAVKCPLAILAALALRPLLARRSVRPEEWVIPSLCLAFVAVACLSSKRNYGFRYLLPLAPMAIVWLSAMVSTKSGQAAAAFAVLAAAWASVVSHPYELTYFNRLAGGRAGGHRVLADSNLDWGQGLIAFRDLLNQRPELADVTLFAFGDVEPAVYGIDVPAFTIDASDRFEHLPPRPIDCPTRFVGVSTSLVFGPWGPPGYFAAYAKRIPEAVTADGTIRIYRTRGDDEPAGIAGSAAGTDDRRVGPKD